MRNILYIFIGGGLGSVLRFLISNYTQKLWNYNAFPIGTFLVNITGCFLIGLFSSYLLKLDSHLRFLLITGLCGGYTTFSTFSLENYTLWQNANYITLAFYILLSIIFGLLAVVFGSFIGKM